LIELPPKAIQYKMARRALLYSSFNLFISVALAQTQWLPKFIWLPFLIQFAETFWGTINPAIGSKPAEIGMRQLAISTLFTVAFILTWNM
jgi:hypothetical protein